MFSRECASAWIILDRVGEAAILLILSFLSPGLGDNTEFAL